MLEIHLISVSSKFPKRHNQSTFVADVTDVQVSLVIKLLKRMKIDNRVQ